MNAVTLIKHNLTHYWRTTLAVILGVATDVLAGAFLVGDSVRTSLRDLALARLGKTDQVVTASGFSPNDWPMTWAGRCDCPSRRSITSFGNSRFLR